MLGLALLRLVTSCRKQQAGRMEVADGVWESRHEQLCCCLPIYHGTPKISTSVSLWPSTPILLSLWGASGCAALLELPQLHYLGHTDSLGIVDSNFESSGKCGSFVDVCSVLWCSLQCTRWFWPHDKLITHGPVSLLDDGVEVGGAWGFLDSCEAHFGIVVPETGLTGGPVIQRTHSAGPLNYPSTETFLPM